MVLILLFPASVVHFQLSCLVVNFIGHMLPSACSPEVGLGEGLGKRQCSPFCIDYAHIPDN